MSLETVSDPHLVERTRSLLEFLARLVLARERPVTDLRTWSEQEGCFVEWLDRLPEEPEIKFQLFGSEPSEPWLLIDRPGTPSWPPPPHELLSWLVDPRPTRPDEEPRLRKERRLAPPDVPGKELSVSVDEGAERLETHPEIQEMFEEWWFLWQTWADEALRIRPVQKIYDSLFATFQETEEKAEELELRLGLGLVSWKPESCRPIRRHLATLGVLLGFDERTGRLSVGQNDEAAQHELEMVPQEMWPKPDTRKQLDDALAEVASGSLDPLALESHFSRWAHILDPSGSWEKAETAIAGDGRLIVRMAPALIYRRRSRQSLLRVYQQILADIDESGDVPIGLVSLVAPTGMDQQSTEEGSGRQPNSWSESPAALLPLATNDEQLQLVARVENRRHTVVQGPPGTGKTHTIANLLSHLLARGQRVLVTAQTDRALKELRGKLPEPLRDLLVAAIGTGRSDLDGLAASVRAINEQAESFNRRESERLVADLESELDRLRREESRLINDLVGARGTEAESIEAAPAWRGTPAALAQRLSAERERYGWIEELVPNPDEKPPLSIEELTRLLELRAAYKPEQASRARCALPVLDAIPSPEPFARMVRDETTASKKLEQLGARALDHPSYLKIHTLEEVVRQEAREALFKVAESVEKLQKRRESWTGSALQDLLTGRAASWQTRRIELELRLDEIRKLSDLIGHTPVDGANPELKEEAVRLQQYLQSGKKFREGWLAPAPVRKAGDLLSQARVGGARPIDVAQLKIFVAWIDRDLLIAESEKLWPADAVVPAEDTPAEDTPAEDTPAERIGWLREETAVLDRVLETHGQIENAKALVRRLDLHVADWGSLIELRWLAQAIDHWQFRFEQERTRKPFEHLEVFFEALSLRSDRTDLTELFQQTVRERNPKAWAAHHEELTHLWLVRQDESQRLEFETRLTHGAPEVLKHLPGLGEVSDWDQRAGQWEAAWTWARVRLWLENFVSEQTDNARPRLREVERKISATTGKLTAAFAWQHAINRLGARELQALKAYALLLKRLGKGTGKYSAHREREARLKLSQCRSAVPAWIMPLYRLTSTLEVTRNAFDVVVIDEASQAGLEAAFLQYLAPKIVVVGDDKQVSPSGVGIDQQSLIDLRRQYLRHVDHPESWEHPQTSFFDQAKLRYGDVITLREHFRCMPEIIEFSSKIAYQPEGIRLVPLRQYGRDRLAPFRIVHVADGYEKGVGQAAYNPPEAKAIVDIIVGCLDDPSYANKTMCVISLTGPRQAREITRLLLEAVSPQELRQRQLRCGIPPDFQGAERDVVFLSMVKGPPKNRTLVALTKPDQIQRFNVAISRARDQVWLFHSVSLSHFSSHPDDLRRLLYEHCRHYEKATLESPETSVRVPEDRRVEPYESLFEQHVRNEIADRGFVVQPQYEVHGRRIDLVIAGGTHRLAVECDGDRWHGPEHYEQDLLRQRELERCGWQFFRIRASHFYHHRSGSLAPLWQLLSDLGIRPGGMSDPEPASDVVTVQDEKAWVRDDGLNPTPLAPRAPFIDSKGPIDATVPSPHPPGLEQGSGIKDAEGGVSVNFESGSGVDSSIGSTQEAPSLGRLSEIRSESEVDPNEAPAVRRVELQAEELKGGILQPDVFGTEHGVLAPHPEVYRSTPDPTLAEVEETALALVEIVGAEGPITRLRLLHRYLDGTQKKKLGRVLRSALECGLKRAMAQGRIVTNESTLKLEADDHTLRLPGQAEVVLRSRGSRALQEIPLEELAVMVRSFASQEPHDDSEEAFRCTLDLLGLVKLTPKAERRLREAESFGREAALAPQPGLKGTARWTSPGPQSARDYGLVGYDACPPIDFPDPVDAEPREMMPGLLELARAHAPATPRYLFRRFVRLAGRNRTSKLIAEKLSVALDMLVSSGDLVFNSATAHCPSEDRTLRVPGQPAVVLRERGDRDLNEIPPDELGALLLKVELVNRRMSREEVFREAMRVLGARRLTSGVKEWLERCYQTAIGELD